MKHAWIYSMYLDLVNSSPWAARGLKIRQLSIYRFMIWKSLSIVHQITRLCQIHVPGQEAWKGAVVAIQALAAYHQWLWFKSFRVPILCVDKMRKRLLRGKGCGAIILTPKSYPPIWCFVFPKIHVTCSVYFCIVVCPPSLKPKFASWFWYGDYYWRTLPIIIPVAKPTLSLVKDIFLDTCGYL